MVDRRIRFITAAGVFLLFRFFFRGWSELINLFQRTANWIEPIRQELIDLLIVLLGRYASVSTLYIDPIGTVILYLAVFRELVSGAYPEELWTALSKEKIAGWTVAGWFRFVVSLHIVVLYLTWTVYDQLQSELGIRWFIAEWQGYPPAIWFTIIGSLYFGVFAPISIGYLLSVPDGGLLSEPESDSAALTFSQGFTSEAIDPNDINYVTEFWLNQGVYHVLPAYILGVLFIVFDVIFPAIELLLAIGIVATLSPWKSFPPGDIERYDLEQRLTQTMRVATTNIKGFTAAGSVIGGLLLGVWVLTLLLPIPVLSPPPGPTGLTIWNRLGFLFSVLVYSVISTLLWLSLADRLPWFIDAWAEDYTTFEGRRISAPSSDPPPRLRGGLGLPIICVIFSLLLAYSTHHPSLVKRETA